MLMCGGWGTGLGETDLFENCVCSFSQFVPRPFALCALRNKSHATCLLSAWRSTVTRSGLYRTTVQVRHSGVAVEGGVAGFRDGSL